MLSAPHQQTCQADPPGWRLVWSDEFDQLSSENWTLINTNVPTNQSLQDYLPQQISVGDGKLVITTENVPSRGLPYRSGQVKSKREQRFGRWEVRAKLPASQGMWPAIWLLPDTERYLWPSGGEIDILENRGNQPHLVSSAFHYGSREPYEHRFVYNEHQAAVDGRLTNYHEGFHTYAVDWTERYARFYVDGVHHYTVYDEDVGGFLSQNTAPMQLVINNAIGGTFLPDPDDSTQWPQAMEVDWVRVYESEPQSFQATLQNSGFETQQGGLAGWSVFGNTVIGQPNVSLSAATKKEGDASLKVYGAFGRDTSFSGVAQGISVVGGAEVEASLSSLVRSDDSIAGTTNRAVLKIEFYSEFGAKYGGQRMIGEQEIAIASSDSVEDRWEPHSLSAIAPANAVEARLAIVFIQPDRQSGAVYVDDVTFTAALPAARAGDFNADGLVNAADYAAWRNAAGDSGIALPADGNGDGRVDGADYRVWRSNYGVGAAAESPAVEVAEPTALAIGATVAMTLMPRRHAPPTTPDSKAPAEED